MLFNERNTVEFYIIQQLTGVNLNTTAARENPAPYTTARWQYRPATDLNRPANEVFVDRDLKDALIRLNPAIARQPARAEEVIYRLRAILLTANTIGLVRANEDFARWLRGEMTMPFGPNHEHVPVHLIDFDAPARNTYVCTNQYAVRAQETKLPDLVLLINGIPVVVGEAKTPVRPSVTWLDGATEIHAVYEDAIPALFVPNILSFATDGRHFVYGAVRTPLDYWCPWRLEAEPDALARLAGLVDVGRQLVSLLQPHTLLDILRNFTLYTTNSKKRRIKVVCRYQQFEGANALVNRVVEGRIRKGLIWHFQGSGKSLLMVFAAQKLRKLPQLRSPTVLIVVDRTDLDTQISGTFSAADVPNLINADSIRDLRALLETDTRKIIITTIHKFQDAYANLNTRDNIIMLVDEAHRTQEGGLGQKMRLALPNAFLFGLTGTPINRADKNTFWTFGAEEDEKGYLSRYTFQDSIRDEQTRKLHFEPRLPNVHIDKDGLKVAFAEMANDLTEDDRNTLSRMAAKMAVFLKAPERIRQIVADIAGHFRTHVEPQGFKAMIVAPDREACVLYKNELDRHFSPETSAVVISTTANDSLAFKQKWALDKEQQEKLLDTFNNANAPLKFLIVTAKLLTGFDAPILQTMYLDKSLKDHTLLQAICRTNRLYPNKTFGRIVDYFGVFDDTAQALAFDEETVKSVITSLKDLPRQLPELMANALRHFPGVDRSSVGFEALMAAQDAIQTDTQRDAFAQDYVVLSKVWEALSPDALLLPYERDYKWLSQVYASVRPASDDTGRLLWHALGAQTTRLIHEHIHVDGVNDAADELVLDADTIDDLMNRKDPAEAQKMAKLLAGRFRKHAGNPVFRELTDRLEEIRQRAEAGLISSLDFLKHLCQLAKDTLEAERNANPPEERDTAKAALTDLFLSTRTDKTPVVVERIVTDIDSIVKIVRFDGWQTTVAGEREVQQSLRKTLLKYQLHKDNDLFDKAYSYIKEYY